MHTVLTVELTRDLGGGGARGMKLVEISYTFQ